MIHQVDTGSGAVAAGHAATAGVGARVLAAGGNAVDAVIGMCFAASVAEGTLTTLGGGGFMMIGGAGQPAVLLDFFVRQPGLGHRPLLSPWESFTIPLDGTVLRFGTGPASVAVPGMPAGLAHASRHHGRLPLEEVAAPAADLATAGVELTETQATEHAMMLELLTRDPEGESVYRATPGGPARKPGETLRQPALAATIEELAATAGESFYTGDIARRLLRWSDSRGGRISREDLEAYRVVEREPLELSVGGVRVQTNPPPAMGGRIITRLVEPLWAASNAGPIERDVSVARALARVLGELKPPPTSAPEDGEPVDLGDGGDLAAPFASSPNTTHVAAVDSDGLVASATTTVGFGAGEYVPGTGIQLNNILAEYGHRRVRAAGAAVQSMMSPTLLVGPNSTVALGSAGSDRIPQAISQVLERMWDGMPIGEAIDSPRFVYDGSSLHAEPGLEEQALEQLATEFALVRWPELHAFFGTSNGASIRDGRVVAAGDTRREGVGIVLSGPRRPH